MPDGRLILGTRRYSSGSLRGWLAVRLAGLNVQETVVPLAGGGQATPELQSLSPSGLAPFLEHNGNRVWETLAICEYCHELSGKIWPADFAARTHARVIATEMHGGFRELRMAMPMNLGRDFTGRGRTPGALADIARIETLWAEGKTPETTDPGELAEARASFAVLAPRRESGGWSLAATLMLGFPDAIRDQRLAALQDFPDRLLLELADGTRVAPDVDRGTAGPEDRLPAVLALRYQIPDGCTLAALVSNHAEVPGRWPAPAAWTHWPS